MRPYKIAPDLYVIEDFVTEEQQKEILEFASSITESSWQKNSWIPPENFFYGKMYTHEHPVVFQTVLENVKNIVYSLYSEEDLNITLLRHKPGQSMNYHKDNHPHSGDTVRYGICIYYNDDYDGGALHYPDLDITHKPKARSLVIHGGNLLHGTTKVKGKNYRYFSTCFIKGSARYPALLNSELFKDIEESDGSFYY